MINDKENSFSIFIGENQAVLDELGNLSRQLQDEVTSWRGYRSLDALAEQSTYFVLLTSVRDPKALLNISSKNMQGVTRQLKTAIARKAFVYADEEVTTAEPPTNVNFRQVFEFKRRMPPQYLSQWNTLTEDLVAFCEGFTEVARPLTMALRSVKQQLFDQLRTYLQADFGNLTDLANFLTDPGLVGKRESVRPFLTRLAKFELAVKRGDSLLDQQKVFWGERFLSNGLPAGLMRQFCQEKLIPGGFGIEEVEKEGQNIKVTAGSSEFVDMLRFAVMLIRQLELTADDIDLSKLDIPAVLMAIPRSSWPQTLLSPYRSFASQIILDTTEQLKRGLAPYYRKEGFIQNGIDLPEIEPKGLGSSDREKTAYDGNGSPEKIDILLPVVADRKLLTEEELTNYVARCADKLADHDQRLEADCLVAMGSLRKEPWGLGTKKMLTGQLSIGNKSVPLREFAPFKRGWLKLQHPLTPNLRFVYAINGPVDDRQLMLEGIFRHDEFDRRYRV